jgi:NAD(P)-dependent dehydrogenase (short-subunit alcohol dehydrogenase family)
MKSNWIDMTEEVCVISGAGGGIGRSLAYEFAGVGATVVLVDRDEGQLEKLVDELSASSGKAAAFACNVANTSDVQNLVKRVEDRVGACTILVNNAGILRLGSLSGVSDEDWRGLFDVNFHGYFNMSRAFGKLMLGRRKGSLIHIASISGSHPQPFSGAYSASKAAILMLSRQLAFEWGPDGVRSNAVSPGLIRTPLSEAFYADDDMRQRRASVVPMRRIADPKDIADAAVFLASNRASYVTGQEIVVDGGFTQTLMSHIPPGYETQAK